MLIFVGQSYYFFDMSDDPDSLAYEMSGLAFADRNTMDEDGDLYEEFGFLFTTPIAFMAYMKMRHDYASRDEEFPEPDVAIAAAEADAALFIKRLKEADG